MTKDLFITFGGGRRGFGLAAKRLGAEVANSSWNADVLVLDTKKAPDLLGADWQMHERFIAQHLKGHGLWIWKSIILRKALKGDFGAYSRFFYLDAGSQFNLMSPIAKKRFEEYLEIASSHGGLSFTHRTGQFGIQDFSEKNWGEPHLHQAMKVDTRLLDLPQIQAGCLFLTPKSLPVIEEWYRWCTKDSYSFLIGNPDIQGAGSKFQHRFDQSIISPLWHMSGMKTLPDETWFAPEWKKSGREFPIWTIRNDSSVRLPANNLLSRVHHRVQVYTSLLMDKLWK